MSLSEFTAEKLALQEGAGGCGEGMRLEALKTPAKRPTLHSASSRPPARPPALHPPERSSQNAGVAPGAMPNWHPVPTDCAATSTGPSASSATSDAAQMARPD